mgnify:CR=1 FL=1
MCAAKKKESAKKEASETKNSGGCGQTLGCLIFISAIVAVLVYFIIIPKLEESGFSFDSFGDSIASIKDEVFNKVEVIKDKAGEIQNKTDEIKDKAGDLKDDAAETIENTTDRIKDAAETTTGEINNRVDSTVKSAPKLVRDDDKDSLYKANIKIYE